MVYLAGYLIASILGEVLLVNYALSPQWSSSRDPYLVAAIGLVLLPWVGVVVAYGSAARRTPRFVSLNEDGVTLWFGRAGDESTSELVNFSDVLGFVDRKLGMVSKHSSPLHHPAEISYALESGPKVAYLTKANRERLEQAWKESNARRASLGSDLASILLGPEPETVGSH